MAYVTKHPNHLPINNFNNFNTSEEIVSNLQLCHERFQCLQKFTCSLVGCFLLIQLLLDSCEKCIELL